MKRWLKGFLAFVAALGLGYSIARLPFFYVAPASPTAALHIDGVSTDSRPEPAAVPTPEFRELPDIDSFNSDIDNTDPIRNKLVDVLHYGNEYRKEESVAKTGENWLGLFESNGNFELRRQKVTLMLDHTSHDPDNGDWVHFKFGRASEPLFLVRKIDSLRPGLVETLYRRPATEQIANRQEEPASLTRGYEKEFRIGGNAYTLRVTSGVTRNGTDVNVLVLESGESKQVVSYNTYFKDATTNYDTVGDPLWIGDLDGDGRLDLYIEGFGYEKGGFSSNLYLSKGAEKGHLVKLVASFSTAGC
ncbi:MAG: hypothetical protein ABI791_15045 [Acidobacteriota bacterium]